MVDMGATVAEAMATNNTVIVATNNTATAATNNTATAATNNTATNSLATNNLDKVA